MFDRIVILASFALLMTSHNRYKKIAFVLFLWLLISDLAHTYLLLEFRDANAWVIYQIYNLINSATILTLTKLYSHMIIIYTLAANILLNITVSFYFISPNVSEIVYNSYSYIAAFLAVTALYYMGMLRDGDRLKRREKPNTSVINLLFFTRINWNKRVRSGNFL
jgi:hypothetical protein